MPTNKRVLVTGGGTFLGDNIAAALLAEGAEVTLLVRPGAEDKLGPLGQRVRWWTADVWDSASLKGRARGHMSVIHTVGSMVADPAKGLSYHALNFVSARNVANMCISGGVQQMLLMSAARAPWVSGAYIASKREAEAYLERIGLKHAIVRAPLIYKRGSRRSPFYMLMTALGSVPPTSWLAFGRIAPMPVDILARGVARIALDEKASKRIYYAGDLRRRNTPRERRRPLPLSPDEAVMQQPSVSAFHFIEEDTPFGWIPPEKE